MNKENTNLTSPNYNLAKKCTMLLAACAILCPTSILAKAETLTEANFNAAINGTDLPVVVDFWAPWCGPCVTLAPTIDELALQTKGKAIVAKVNIDENPGLAQKYGIQAIPAIYFFKNGNVQNQMRGVQSLDALMGALSPSLAEGGTGSRPSGEGRSMLARLIEASQGE